jgi:hypothetical protein
MTFENAHQISYKPGKANTGDIERELDALWVQLQKDESLREQARGLGIDLTVVDGRSRAEVLDVEQQGPGFDPATTAIVVAFAPVAARIVEDLWVEILLPKLKQILGEDAIGDRAKF